MTEKNLDLTEDLNGILSRGADLNRWCLRAMERGGVSSDTRKDMMDAASRIRDLASRLPGLS